MLFRSVFFCGGIVDIDCLGAAYMKVSVGFGGKAGVNFLYPSRIKVAFDNIGQKIGAALVFRRAGNIFYFLCYFIMSP